MSAYIPVDLQRRIRTRYFNACADCRTAESLTGMTFEFEHIIPISVKRDLRISVLPAQIAIGIKQIVKQRLTR